jgi:hypothetical protein
MYSLTEQSVERLLQACKKLHDSLRESPLWELLKNEPVVVNFTGAFEDLDKEVNKTSEEKV